MELRPGDRQTKAAAIPEDWLASTIGGEADLLTGFPFPSEGFAPAGVRLLRGSNVKRGVLDWGDDITECWPSVTPKIQRYELEDGDVVIAMDGALVGRSYAVVAGEDLPALLVQRVARIRSRSADLGLLGAWIASENFVRHVDSVKTHTAIPHISPRDIREFALSLPTERNEQRAIATALTDVDALLGGLDRLIAKKRDLKHGAMQQLLTGQARLPGFRGGWEVKRLGDYATFLRNGVNSRAELLAEGRVKYLHYGDVHGCKDVYLSPDFLPCLPDTKAASLARLRDGDLIIADASEDVVGVSKSVEVRGLGIREVVAGLHTIAARFDKNVLADGFKGFLQFCPPFASQLRRLAAGTKVYATNRAHVASVEMRLPTVAEQAAIAAVLSDMDAEVSALEARRDKTRDLKQAMMQELLTGKTRLVPVGGANA